MSITMLDRTGFYAPEKLGKTRRITPEGFMVCENVKIARIGEQLYHEREVNEPGKEITIKGNGAGEVIVHRIPEEVFHPDTLASFQGKPITVEHPNRFVCPDNWNQLSVGTVQNPRRGEGIDDDFIVADLLITAADAIQYVDTYLPQLSAGYSADYDQPEIGHAFQRNIRGNHVALVDRGRAGPRVAIQDSLPEEVPVPMSRTFKTVLREKLAKLGVVTADAEAVITEVESITLQTADKSAVDTQAILDAIKAVGDRVAVIEDAEKKRKDAEKAMADKAAADAAAAATTDDDEDDDLETDDTVLEAEGPGMTINMGKVYGGEGFMATNDSASDPLKEIASRAEVLAPGIAIPTKDSLKGTKGKVLAQFMRDSLKACAAKDQAGAEAVRTFTLGRKVDDLLGGELLGAFNGAASLMRARNNPTVKHSGVRTGDFSKPLSIADLNKQNAEFWANR